MQVNGEERREVTAKEEKKGSEEMEVKKREKKRE